MIKDAPIGSPMFHLYNVLYLTFFTGLMTFGMLFVYYLTYEDANPFQDVENMLGQEASQYNIVQSNITPADIEGLENSSQLNSYFAGATEILRFFVTDKDTDAPVMTVVSVSSGAFGGAVTMLVGTDETTIKALTVVDASGETAGLGQRITETAFLRQFIDKTRDDLPMSGSEWGTKGIDMISGATISSDSVVNSIVKAFNLYQVGGN